MLERHGVGYETTSALLCAAGDNPGRLETEAGFAALCGSSRAVTNSEPLMLSIAPTHNLTPMPVLPVAIGVPLALVGGSGALLWHRYRLSGR